MHPILLCQQGPTGGLSVVEVKVASEEGSWKRPRRKLVARVLLGDGAYVQAEGWDGDAISVPLPSAAEADRLVAAAVEEEKALMEAAPILPDGAKEDGEDGGGEALAATNMAAGDLQCHVVLKHGGRLDSLFHYPSGQELLESRFEEGGYEEYSESEYRSPGCQEQYHVVCEQRDHSTGGSHRMIVQGDIGSGLIMRRCFSLGQPIPAAWAAATTTAAADAKSLTLGQEQQDPSTDRQDGPMMDGPAIMDAPASVDAATSALPSTPNQLHVTSAIIAAAIGAGSGGFSRRSLLPLRFSSFPSAAPHMLYTSASTLPTPPLNSPRPPCLVPYPSLACLRVRSSFHAVRSSSTTPHMRFTSASHTISPPFRDEHLFPSSLPPPTPLPTPVSPV
ncbi:unnamed protein product [Closterium sp. Naga37s-1]|nr:unnamed protein product [Closterium sp. Naga37s-1]